MEKFTSDEDDVEKRCVIDLVKDLSGWWIKGKRGRKAKTPFNSPSVFEQPIMAIDGASNLLALANVPLEKQYLPLKKRKMEFSPIIDNKGNSYSKSNINDSDGIGKSLENVEDGDKEKNKKTTLTSDHHHTMMLISPAYRCSLCSKGFSKRQALGGHSRHCKAKIDLGNKKINSQILAFDLNEPPAEDEAVEDHIPRVTISVGWRED